MRELLPGASADEVVDRVGHGIEAREAVPAAIASVVLQPHEFDAALEFAWALGGDVDTIGAMAGAITGALHGEEAVPDEWRDVAEGTDRAIALADRLFERALGRTGESGRGG